MTETELLEKKKAITAKVVPLCRDSRAEAAVLFKELQSPGCVFNVLRFYFPHMCRFELYIFSCRSAADKQAVCDNAPGEGSGAGSSTDPPVKKALAKAAVKSKAKSKPAPKQGKVGVLELSRTKAADIREALPRYNRAETKKSLSNEIMTKVTPACIEGLWVLSHM